MIVRSARQKTQRNVPQTLQSIVNQLQLPWLCPAFNGHPRHQQRSRKTTTSIERTSTYVPTSNFRPPYRTNQTRRTPTDRGLAYATSVEQNFQDEHLPWDTTTRHQQNPPFPASWLPKSTQSDLPKFDPAKPVIISSSMQLAPRKFRYDSSVGGEIGDIHQILQACLQVGRLDRASITMRRLNCIYKLDAPELTNAHNAYIGAVVAKIVITKDQELLRHLHKWFQVEIRGVGIKPNETTFALMVQATLNDSNEKKVGRTVRRYLALSKDEGIYDEARTATLTHLSDWEAAKVTRYDEASFYPSPEPVEDKGQASPALNRSPASEATLSSVRAHTQKGLGLIALQKSLHPLSDITGQTAEGLEQDSRVNTSRFARQKQLEECTMSSALDRWRIEHEDAIKVQPMNPVLRLRPVGSLMWTWHEALLPLIKEEVEKVRSLGQNIDDERATYGPFLQQVEPEKLSAVTIISCLRNMTKTGVRTGVTTATLVCAVGKAIEEETLTDGMKSRGRFKASKSEDPQARARRMARLLKQERYAQKSQSGSVSASQSYDSIPSTATNITEWSALIRARIGAVMVALLLQAAKFETPVFDTDGKHKKYEPQPAFTKIQKFQGGQKCGIITINQALADKLAKDPVPSVIAKHLPMLVEPLPWTDFNQGGYLSHPSKVVRFGTTHKQTKDYIEVAAKNGDMAQVFAALDILGRTPWKINRQVFDVMVQVWNGGEALANIPAANPQMEYPPEPDPTASEEVRKAHAFKVKQIEDIRDGMHSNRCFQNFQLEVAKAFLDEKFYFPHNMDFRGRAYPIPPYLNHMGADHCRGILMFSEGKKLGQTGLTWLRVHVANLFGYDKASIVERKDFAIKHTADIYDSATNPLDGQRWWLKAESPWQCLATCIELKNALDSPEPAEYISHLPVHQDGTCNGLQHYAALGGDAIGARQVNLEPGERPSDIYTAVAEMVQQDVAKDAASGNEVAQLLNGKIKRKVVKQTVMTNVYGVTFAGAKLQVLRKIEELYPRIFEADSRLAFSAASYVAKKIFTALSLMFNGAHDIQYWLGECASRISSSLTREQVQYIEDKAVGKEISLPYNRRAINERSLFDEHTRQKTSVIWTTPLKMPVVQPYRKSNAKRVITNLQHINIVEPTVSDPVSKRKQLQAFPPNFIHSLDATHMFLSALKCDELGLTFAAVHDSFWTHASTVDTMNTVLRDAFIRMHSEDIMGRLAAEFKARYSGGMYLASIRQNSVLGKKIAALRRSDRSANGRDKKSTSDVKIDELIREKRRLRLLESEDSAMRAEGEAMVTPAKLFQDTVDERDHMFLEDMVGAIGEIQEVLESSATGPDGETAHDGIEAHHAVEELPVPQTEDAARKAKAAKQGRRSLKIWAWLPLTFPAVPKKGSFDVARLKDSKYFFS